MRERERTGRNSERSDLDGARNSWSMDTEAPDLSTGILASLRTLGYAHVARPHTAGDFEMAACQLGSIVLRTDLAITPERSSIVYKSDEIKLHQDNPEVNILGWYCVQQDELDGSALLLDTGDIAGHFSGGEIATMTTVNVRYPDPDQSRHNPDRGLIAYLLWPLVTEKSTRTEVYYVPWLLADSYDENQRRVLAKFTEYLRAKEETQLVRIRLKAGESLFIDNNRMLHGRGSISQDSKRFLKRVWIKR